MASSARWRLMRCSSSALLALLAWGALAPPARAGCVHDALSRSQEPAGAAHFRWLIARGAMAAPAGEPTHSLPPSDRPAPGRPCDGPTCSGHDGLPPVPTSMMAPAGGSWAWHAGSGADAATGSESLIASESRPRPVRRGPSIFHPPRPHLA